MLRATLAKLVAAKFLTTAAVATAATGGLALAAVTGVLPTGLHQAAHPGSGAPSSTSANHSQSRQGKTGTRSDGTPDLAASDAATPTDDPTPSTTPKATPSPSLTGLCTAYQAGAGSSHSKALDNPAFTVLVTTAGGRDNIATYCTTLIGPAPTHPTGRPSTRPTHPSGPPTRRPTHRTGPPTSQRTGPPATHSSHPNGPPATHPGGQPITAPTHPTHP